MCKGLDNFLIKRGPVVKAFNVIRGYGFGQATTAHHNGHEPQDSWLWRMNLTDYSKCFGTFRNHPILYCCFLCCSYWCFRCRLSSLWLKSIMVTPNTNVVKIVALSIFIKQSYNVSTKICKCCRLRLRKTQPESEADSICCKVWPMLNIVTSECSPYRSNVLYGYISSCDL